MVNQQGIKVISECFVRPERQVEAAKQPFYLGPVDLVFLSLEPIQKGLLFPFESDSTRSEISSLVQRLKRALSTALVHFYPLAGRFETKKYEDEHACWIYLDCTKGPGARLIHAQYVDLTVSDILSSVDVHPAVRSFFDLGEKMLNFDGHTKPVLSIQVTELQDGVFMGFTMNHSVVDGTSFIHFVSSLSEIFRSDKAGKNPVQLSRVPLYNNKVFAPEGYGPVFKLPYLEPEKIMVPCDPGPLRVRIFHFSPESMARLKAKANEGCGAQEIISSYMSLSSFVRRSITRAYNLEVDEKIYCSFALNARPRLNPPLSDDYFGNIVASACSTCQVDELASQNLGRGARALTQEIKKVTHEAIVGFLKMLAERPFIPSASDKSKFYGAPNGVVFGGSHRFDMYGPEFGLGRAAAVLLGDGNRENGKVTANPGREGRGSVDLEICLRPHVMSALETDEEFMSFVSIG